MKEIDVEHLNHVLSTQEHGRECCLIDVRTVSEYKNGHVPGAILICLDTLASRVDEIPKNGDVYLICRSGARSAQAANYLTQEGVNNNLINVTGGTMAWMNAGFPIERG